MRDKYYSQIIQIKTRVDFDDIFLLVNLVLEVFDL
jgi:hypothetical protein